MKKLLLTLCLMCASTSLMAGETYFKVHQKKDVNDFMTYMDNQVDKWNEEYKANKGFRVLDIQLDDSENGYAVIKYEYYQK